MIQKWLVYVPIKFLNESTLNYFWVMTHFPLPQKMYQSMYSHKIHEWDQSHLLWVTTHLSPKMHQLTKFDSPMPHSVKDKTWTQIANIRMEKPISHSPSKEGHAIIVRNIFYTISLLLFELKQLHFTWNVSNTNKSTSHSTEYGR